MRYCIDVECPKCRLVEVDKVFASKQDFEENCLCKCGEKMVRRWVGRGATAGSMWLTSCPTASGGSGGC